MDNQTQKNILIGGALGLGALILYGLFKKNTISMYNLQKGHGPRYDYVIKNGMNQTPQQKQLIQRTKELFPKQAMMLGGQDAAELLANLIRVSGAKKGFEIGVFTGYSTLTMAMALPEDGKIFAIDINKDFTDLGQEHWQKQQVDNKINLILTNAVQYLEELCEDENNLESFDFAFVDADKQNYKNYYELLLKLLKKGGWICFDNAMAGGGVYDRKAKGAFKEEDSDALDTLNRNLNADERVSNILIDIADGVHFVVKNQLLYNKYQYQINFFFEFQQQNDLRARYEKVQFR